MVLLLPFTVNPMITSPPETLTVITPGVASFSCSATARPRPILSWRRVNGNESIAINNSTKYSITEVTNGDREITSVLTIMRTDESDSSNYECVATNIVSTATEGGTLTVHSECLTVIMWLDISLSTTFHSYSKHIILSRCVHY